MVAVVYGSGYSRETNTPTCSPTLSQGKYEEAAPLYERAIAIWEALHVMEHPRVAEVLANYAEILIAQVRVNIISIGKDA